MDDLNKLIETMKKYSRQSIRLDIAGKPTGRSHFGGLPELPDGVKYPSFECLTYDDDEENLNQLHFLAQIDCEEIAEFDRSGLLPKTGTLLFFYQCDSDCWGFDPKDAGCARVIYYEGNGKKIEPSEEIAVFPEIGIKFTAETSYPDLDALITLSSDKFDYELYDAAREMLGSDESGNIHKLLGWSDPIQGPMEYECELISRGYYLGRGYPKLSDADELERKSYDEWLLLFQLDTVSKGNFELMFGDCGRIYFFIRREDLASKRFDRVWMILQCG